MNAPVNFDPRAHAWSLPLDKLDLSDPGIFQDDIWHPYFERHRKEAPVNYIPDSAYGPYWSVAKYKDIVQVEVNHKVFSSSDEVGGIMINDAPKGMERTSFIRMDPPHHDVALYEVPPSVVDFARRETEKALAAWDAPALLAFYRKRTQSYQPYRDQYFKDSWEQAITDWWETKSGNR